MTLSRIALFLGVGSVVVAPLPSQEVHAAVGRLKPGVLVRVHERELGRFAGRLQYVGPDAIGLGPTPGYATLDTVVALADIDTVWVLRSLRTRGLLIGAATGGVLGYAIASQNVDICPGQGSCEGDRVVPTLVSMLVCGAIGWLIGDSHYHWARHFP